MASYKGVTYIEDESKRKNTCKKRKAGLMKKMNELSILCGIEACAVIYDPNKSQPEVWPSHSKVQSLINKFMEIPEMEQSKYMLNQETLLSKNIDKARDQLKRMRDENKRKDMELFMFQCLNSGSNNVNSAVNVNMVDTDYLLHVINQNLRDIEWKQSRAATKGEVPLNNEKVHGMEQTNMAQMQMQDWSSDSTNDAGYMMLPFGEHNFSKNFFPGPSFP